MACETDDYMGHSVQDAGTAGWPSGKSRVGFILELLTRGRIGSVLETEMAKEYQFPGRRGKEQERSVT